MLYSTPPKRPYKNLRDAKERLCQHNLFGDDKKLLNDRTFYPCLRCHARGSIYDPSEKPDVIEGYKLVGRIQCPQCQGSRRGSREAFMDMYNDALGRWKRDLAEYNKALKRYKELEQMLTPEDFNIIRTFS